MIRKGLRSGQSETMSFCRLKEKTIFLCSVDLIQRESPERAEERDDLQDQVYSDDLDQRVQRAVEVAWQLRDLLYQEEVDR